MSSEIWYKFHMKQAEFAERIRARLIEIGGTPIGVAAQAGLPRDAIRSVLRGHPPNLLRADEICRALGITLTIGARRARPQSMHTASDSPIALPPTVSPDATRAEHFAHVVEGRLADLFERIVEAYEKTRTDAERELLFRLIGGHAMVVSNWFMSFVESDAPPIESISPPSEPNPDMH